MKYTVRVDHGTYSKTVIVWADDDDEAKRKARSRLQREGFFCLPMAYESVRIISAEQTP